MIETRMLFCLYYCDQVWEDATDLKFTKKNSGKVHIEIRSSR